MRLEARKYLYDIQEAAKLAAQFTDGKDFAEYQRNPMLRFAVERAFAVIGEALAQLARVDSALAAKITDFRNIVAFRNILVHAYAQVDGPLKKPFQRILEGEKCSCVIAGRERLELHQKIEVAALRIVGIAEGRTKQFQLADVKLAAELDQLSPMFLNGGIHGFLLSI